jgi:dipeptidyl aminopeptidase/acylaminoacyl peptidase
MNIIRPIVNIVRFGDITASMWYSDDLQSDSEYRFMIVCPGLPGHPYSRSPAKLERLIERGFVLFYPDYIGTWGSYGKMSWENCVDTVSQSIEFIKQGKGESAYDRSIISWRVKDIILVGGSFGGSVVLVAGAKSEDIGSIISVAAPTNWRDHSRIPEEPGEPIDELYNSIQRGWENLWRIPSKKEWDRLARGDVDLNPIDYIEELSDKNTLLIHGEVDNIVAARRSVELDQKLEGGKGKHELLILQGEGHRGNDLIGREDITERVLRFLG